LGAIGGVVDDDETQLTPEARFDIKPAVYEIHDAVI
jgi:hypothetical protein